ncbi:lipase secretion chaperone [Undibacterium sp. SXout20W]|uniref:lipase secretion chaperone n=1 Tax=Undibacterium sp. SXout20W TaxID=3413051 RepID=UPI003BF1CD9A
MKQSLLAAAFLSAVFFLWKMETGKQEPAVRLTANDHQFSFVRSLEGTSIDGNVSESNDGNLLISAELKRLFDYYLSAMGEKSLPEIRAQIEKILDQKLKPNAAQQAKQLLNRYIAYKQALVNLETDTLHANANANVDANDMLTAVKNKWDSMRHIRSQFFSDKEIQAMFGFDDTYDQDALARMAISQDKNLNEAQKKEKLQALDTSMSPELREAKTAPYQVIRLTEQSEKMRREGASDDEIYRMRAAATSPEAANRLAQLDQETNEWNKRINQYLTQRKQLALDQTNTDSNEQQSQRQQQLQQQQLQQLRNHYFTAQEQARLAAYE